MRIGIRQRTIGAGLDAGLESALVHHGLSRCRHFRVQVDAVTFAADVGERHQIVSEAAANIQYAPIRRGLERRLEIVTAAEQYLQHRLVLPLGILPRRAFALDFRVPFLGSVQELVRTHDFAPKVKTSQVSGWSFSTGLPTVAPTTTEA